jgi:hypothetical protein
MNLSAAGPGSSADPEPLKMGASLGLRCRGWGGSGGYAGVQVRRRPSAVAGWGVLAVRAGVEGRRWPSAVAGAGESALADGLYGGAGPELLLWRRR